MVLTGVKNIFFLICYIVSGFLLIYTNQIKYRKTKQTTNKHHINPFTTL